MKKAIRINVEKRILEDIEISSELSSITDAIGNNCSLFCCPVDFDNGDTIYADDESLLRYDDIKGGFIMPDFRVPLVGNAIVLGTDEEGDSIDVKTDINELAEKIIFISEEMAKEYSIKAMNTPPVIISNFKFKNED